MEEIKFSIIIPVYNCEKYIERCVNSILSQDYKNIEIIIIDDCSEDQTRVVLEKYNDNSNIKIFSTPTNSRQGAARNIGLEHAVGNYILFVDADDFITDNILGKIVDNIKNNNYPDIIYMGMRIQGRRELELIPDSENTNKEYRLTENPYMNCVSICWKRKLIENNHIRFPEKMSYEDVYFSFYGIEKAKSYTFMNEIFYIYDNRKDSTTTDYSLSQAEDTIKLIKELFKLYDKVDEENKRFLEVRILQQSERAKVRLGRAVDSEIKKRAN